MGPSLGDVDRRPREEEQKRGLRPTPWESWGVEPRTVLGCQNTRVRRSRAARPLSAISPFQIYWCALIISAVVFLTLSTLSAVFQVWIESIAGRNVQGPVTAGKRDSLATVGWYVCPVNDAYLGRLKTLHPVRRPNVPQSSYQ
jgi:hypothetical protein